ncbi:BGTF surface domain-containing protein [Halorubrum sp. PV6]|uniref:BGTF surface domain-containing protein n=1 Tax=Halorubrum sp. PV6 TaxID=634157 RepID=UPI000F8524F0|nr:BGTF surface domain-containing protein [Halorubrum sp. PV6]AZQ15675.1 hypothetical protein DOS48_12945 [Halorubrum sp. PV6]
MTSRDSPDGTARPPRTTTDAPSSGRGASRRESTLRSRLAALRVVLVALAVVLSLFGGAVAGPAAAAVADDDGAAAGGEATAGDIVTPALESGASEAVSREISGGFSRDMFTGTAGDPVEIRHVADASGDDTAYMLVGGNRLTDSGGTVGFVDVLKVTGSSTVINTRLMGTDESNVDSCANVTCDLTFKNNDGEVIAENLSALHNERSIATGAAGLARPLAPERYRLAVTNGTFIVRDNGAVDPVKVAAESDLVLRSPTFHDEVEVFTTADGDVIADGEGDDTETLADLRTYGTDRTAVTKGDRVVLGFESTGIWGALSHFAASEGPLESDTSMNHTALERLLTAEEGVSLEIRQTNPGRNDRAATFDLSDADADDVRVFLADGTELERGEVDRAPSRFYLAIDTSDGGPFTDDPEPGDEYAVEFALEGTEGERYAFDGGGPPAAFDPAPASDDRVGEQYPYHGIDDGRVSAEATFSIKERFLRYDHVTDDRTILVEAGNGTITGTTSILPSAELSATVVRDTDDAPNRTESELTVANESFSVDSGLAGVAPGTRASYRLYRGQSLQDSRPVLVVENATSPAKLWFRNETTTTNLTVTRGESLANLSAAIQNVGQLENREQLTLDVDDGEIVEERYVTVGPQRTKNETFAETAVDLEPGEYEYTLAIDGDSVNGTLNVRADPAVTRLDESGSSGESDSSGDVSTDESGESDADTGEETGEAADDGGEETGATSGAPGDGGETPDEEGPATFLPFGIGTRETFGGTVLVGATYLLGHWV